MERTQYDWQHQYLVTPPEYPISANENHSTYDQFIQLRDTLIFSGKFYNNKAGKRLIVWDKWDGTTTNTIEIEEVQYFRQSFEPWFESDTTKISTLSLGQYITKWTTWTATYPEMTCTINKDGHYRLTHKEQMLNLDSNISKVYCYVNHHHQVVDGQGNITWQEIPRAVFDWEWSFSKTFTGSVSTDEGSGTSSTTVSFKLWEIIQKMTAFGYIEVDIKKWDWLELIMEDQNGNRINSSTYTQQLSNWRCIEYLWTPYTDI